MIKIFLEDQEQNGDGQNMYLDHFATSSKLAKIGQVLKEYVFVASTTAEFCNLILKSAIYEEMF